MNSLRVAASAFAASAAVHAFLGYTIIMPWSSANPGVLEPIQIDYVRNEKVVSSAVSTELPDNKPKKVYKKVKGIPVPRMQTAIKPKEAPASDFQKIIDEKIKKQIAQLRHLEAPVSETRISSSMTSAELIADPVKGAVFIGYFAQVKKKIQNTVFRNAGRNLYGRGSVCLGFVLNAQGVLEQLAVLTRGTHADDSMKELAVKCVRDSAPFGSFPRDLGPRRISFNITIFFDGTD